MDDDTECHYHHHGNGVGDETNIKGILFYIIIEGHPGNEKGRAGEAQKETLGNDHLAAKEIEQQHAQKKGEDNGNPPDGGGGMNMGRSAVGNIQHPGPPDQIGIDGGRDTKEHHGKKKVAHGGRHGQTGDIG